MDSYAKSKKSEYEIRQDLYEETILYRGLLQWILMKPYLRNDPDHVEAKAKRRTK